MDAKLFIPIPVFNRRRIAEQCIPTVYDGMNNGFGCDYLFCYDDGSTEWNDNGKWLFQWADLVFRSPVTTGIEAQRKQHFNDFWERRNEYGFTHMYLTDSDALHDPSWRSKALALQEEHNGAPLCLYNTVAHSSLVGNTLEDKPRSNVIWRRFAPGISYLLTLEHVEKVMSRINDLRNWDWQVPEWLGMRFAISRVSYCDHLGLGGAHHPVGEGLDGGDRCLNPTPWLVSKRAEVVQALSV
jgi:hypothetical protein